MDYEITKEEFSAYEKCRMSGKTNMFDLTVVCHLSKLTRDVVKNIMRQYGELAEKYPEVIEQWTK